MDDQVKIRGFRIELGEIEAILGAHCGVKQVAVVAREGVAGDKQLVAYYVPAGESRPTPGDLRCYTGNRLPDYMVPAHFVELPAMPLTPNGKVDRRSLPAPDTTPAVSYEPPRTPVEDLLAGIWSEVLHLERIGIRDNFFDLGGQSLLGVQIATRLRKQLNLDISLQEIFDNPTIASLALVILRNLQQEEVSVAARETVTGR